MCKKVSSRKTYAGCQLPFPDQHFLDEDLLQLESCSPDGINPCTDVRRSSQVIFGSSYVGGDCPTCMYDSALQAKRVDFGIYLSQDDDQRQLLRNHLEARNIALEALGVNQTPVYAEYIRWLPQLLAVDTKTGEPNGVSASE
jgi:hypothetical protein